MSPVTAILTAASIPAMPRRPARPSLPFASPWPAAPSSGAALAVECSSRPQKKATKHHIKSRPKKTQPWDIRRRPTQYPPLPPLPPDWTLVAAGATVDASASASRPPPPSAVEVTTVAADDDAE